MGIASAAAGAAIALIAVARVIERALRVTVVLLPFDAGRALELGPSTPTHHTDFNASKSARNNRPQSCGRCKPSWTASGCS